MQEEKIYKDMYLRLFNAVSDALELLEKEPGRAVFMLKAAQQECEEMYIQEE